MRVLLFLSVAIAGLLFPHHAVADIVDRSGNGFAFPDNDPAGASSSIVVTTDEVITDFAVELYGLTHSWVGDLIITISNGTQTVELAHRVGRVDGLGSGDSSNLDGNYFFEDGGDGFWDAAAGTTGTGVIPPGTYAPSGFENLPTSLVDAFAGTSTMGTWTLFISDNAGGDLGSVDSWGLSFISYQRSIPEPGTVMLVCLLGIAGFTRSR